MRTALLTALLMLASATALAADLTLAPLADALARGDSKAVLEQLANQPADAAEMKRFEARIKLLHRHRDTRLGRLFFDALRGVPTIGNVPVSATATALTVRWPLNLDCELELYAAFTKRAEGWRISEFRLSMSGARASMFATAAPYFASGENTTPIPLLLDREEIDELRPGGLFALEAGVCGSTINKLRDVLKSEGTRTKIADALRPHLATETERKKLTALLGAPEFRTWRRFVTASVERLEAADELAVAASVPTLSGASVTVATSLPGNEPGAVSATRLANGKVAPRVEPPG